MSEKKSVMDMVLEKEKEGVIVFMGIEGAMGAPIADFIKQPAEGIPYDINRDELTLISQFSEDNIRWVNDYAACVTIKALSASNAKLREALETARKSVIETIQQALSGETERYILDDGHRKYTRWGLVEEDIRAAFEIAEEALR